jgi:hypothetical protein
MALQFCGVNQRLDELKRLEYLRPITFSGKGNISGVGTFQASSLQAGLVTITPAGDVTGIRNLHASGTIRTDASLELNEFTTVGKVQSGGPIIAASTGYVTFVGVGADDADYGKNSPFYTRPYPCLLPDVSPPLLYVWSIEDSSTHHLKITQGDYTYTYNFPLGWYTASDICAKFNGTLLIDNDSPLLLAYDDEMDTFTISVDDSYGNIKEPARPDFTPSYLVEFFIDGSSLLLQRLGFISTEEARSTTSVQDIQSSSRVLSSTYPTTFYKTSGSSQGHYFGGVKNDYFSNLWSPATHTWVGADNAQTCHQKVIKSLSEARSANGLTNEHLHLETLKSDSLLSLSGTVTAPTFTFPTETPYEYETNASQSRQNIMEVASLSDAGSFTLYNTDSTPTYYNDLLQDGSVGSGTLNLMSRNPKTENVGPSIAFVGGLTNSDDALSSGTRTSYASIKAVPNSGISTSDVDDTAGGQLVFLTSPSGQTVPVEALRINENQQLCVGLTSTSESRTLSSYQEKLYVNGTAYIDGSVYTTGTMAVGTTVVSNDYEENVSLYVGGGVLVVDPENMTRLGSSVVTGDLSVSGIISNDSFQTLETQVNAIISVLADNYDAIDVVASPTPTFAGINVSSILTAKMVTSPSGQVGTVSMDYASFTSAEVSDLNVTALTADTGTVDTLHCTTGTIDNLTVGSLGVTTFTSTVASFSSMSSPDANLVNINAGSGTFSSTLSVSGGISGTLSTPAQPLITGVGTLRWLDVDGDFVSSSATINGIVTSSEGYDGLLLTPEQPNITGLGTITSLDATNASIQSLSVDVTTTGTLAVTTSLTASVGVIDSLISNNSTVVGVTTTTRLEADSVAVTNALTAASCVVSGVSSASGGFEGILLTSDQPLVTSVGTLTSLSVDSTVLATNVLASDTFIASGGYVGTILTPYQPYINQLGTLDNLTINNELVAGSLNISSSFTVKNFYGTVCTPLQPNITSLGTLTDLNVSGVATASTFVGTNLSLTGVCTATQGFSGILLTTNQANVTQLGTLTNLSVSGVTTSSQFVGTNALLVGVATTGSLAVSTNLNVNGVTTSSSLRVIGVTTTGSLAVSTNLNVSGVTTSGSLQVTGVTTTGSLAVSTNLNVSGVTTSSTLQVTGVSTMGSLAVSTNLNVAGVGTAAALHVTGVGTVGSLGVSTNLNVSGVTTSANLNVSGVGTVASLRVTGVGTVGSLGVSTNLSVSGVTTSANLNVSGVTTSTNLNVSGVGTIASLSVTSSLTAGTNIYLGSTTSTYASAKLTTSALGYTYSSITTITRSFGTADNQQGSVTSISVPAGVWLLQVFAQFYVTSSQSSANFDIAVYAALASTDDADVYLADSLPGVNMQNCDMSYGWPSSYPTFSASRVITVTSSSNTTYYFNYAYSHNSGSSCTMATGSGIAATRIA